MSYWINKKKYDVLINGGGIAGVSCAFWLSQLQPKLKVAIYEPHYLGYGATGRNAGFLTCGSINYFSALEKSKGKNLALEIWNSYKENHERLKPFTKDCDYELCGATTWAVDENEKEKLEETFSLFPELDLSMNHQRPFILGVHNPYDASIHPLKLLKSISSTLTNVDFLIGPDSLEQCAGGDVTIYAKNGFSNHDLITPQRGQILMFSSKKKILNSLGYNTKNLVYFKQLPSLEVIIGGARTIDEDTEQTKELGVNPKIQAHLAKFAKEFLGLTEEQIINSWSGIMGFSPDHQPVVGQIHPKKEYLLGGFSGHGMGIAFLTAKYLVENIIYQTPIPTWMDINRFNNDKS